VLKRLPRDTPSTRDLRRLTIVGAALVLACPALASDYPPPPGPYPDALPPALDTPAAGGPAQAGDATAPSSRLLPLPLDGADQSPGAYTASRLFGAATGGKPTAPAAPAGQDAAPTEAQAAARQPAFRADGYYDPGAAGVPYGAQFAAPPRGYAGDAYYPADPAAQHDPAGPPGRAPGGPRFRSTPPQAGAGEAAASDPPRPLGTAGQAVFRPPQLSPAN
jgi:hypothetical protein